ncbi:hypothetical protein GOBAR_DD36636 [Gossypium barbadense]|nr:hypothetical protein GOBAR_DD36636 [Gossypium barbadense]
MAVLLRDAVLCLVHFNFLKFASLSGGNLIRMDSDTQAMKSFNRGNIMVITNQRGRIDELVNLQVGNQFYPIRVIEVESSVLTNQMCYCKVLESSSKEEMDSRPDRSASSQNEFSECSRKLNLQEEESTNLEVEDDDIEITTTERYFGGGCAHLFVSWF